MAELGRKIVVARLWRKLGIQQFFALHQLSKEFWDFELEIHLLIEDLKHDDDWTTEIKNFVQLGEHREYFPLSCKIYSLSDIHTWVKRNYEIGQETIKKFTVWKHIYQILFYFYLWKEKGKDYIFAYDDDIIFNPKFDELFEVDACLAERRPFFIAEKEFPASDKVMLTPISFFLNKDITPEYMINNQMGYGVNAGFMGISLDNCFNGFFESEAQFLRMLSLFRYEMGERGPDKKLRSFGERYMINTQEQSFFSVMQHISSPKPGFIQHLTPDQDYIVDVPMSEMIRRSKVIHFTGGRKEFKTFGNLITDYLKKHHDPNIDASWFYK